MYKYGMKLRGFSIGAQPMKNFIRREDDPTGRFWDILVYAEKLPDNEVFNYDLEYIGEYQ